MKRLTVFLAVLVTSGSAFAQQYYLRGSHQAATGSGADWDCSSELVGVAGVAATYQWVWPTATNNTYEFKVDDNCDWGTAWGSGGACTKGAACALSTSGGNSSWTIDAADNGKRIYVNWVPGTPSLAWWATSAAAPAVNSVAQQSPTGTVDPGTSVTIRMILGGALPAG